MTRLTLPSTGTPAGRKLDQVAPASAVVQASVVPVFGLMPMNRPLVALPMEPSWMTGCAGPWGA